MAKHFLFIACIASCLQCCAQDSPKSKTGVSDIKVGARCEGCEAIYESPVPFEKLNNTDTLPGFTSGPPLLVTGTIFQRDGKTPAAGVVLYVYHTDQAGIYATRGDEKGWGKRHGYMRGWMKTGTDGKYAFYTSVPASYPNSNNPKHIHPTIKEPGKTEYWIDEFVFDDDPLLPAGEKNRSHPVGGNGVLKPVMQNGMLVAKRDIVLGLNVQNYPRD